MNEAGEEHHVAELLIAEFEELDGRGDRYDAKFTALVAASRGKGDSPAQAVRKTKSCAQRKPSRG